MNKFYCLPCAYEFTGSNNFCPVCRKRAARVIEVSTEPTPTPPASVVEVKRFVHKDEGFPVAMAFRNSMLDKLI